MAEDRRLRPGLAAAALQPCLLCDAPEIAITAAFAPTAAFISQMGAAPGSLIFYSLCAGCCARTDAAEAVEEWILADRA